jgi:hypothetical protein
MLLLLASLAALLAGPLIVRAFGASRGLLSMLDAFVITSITGLIFLDVLPSALVGAGLWPVGAAALGLWLPRGLEHVLEGQRTEGRGRLLLVVAALVGLAIHAMLDGAALAPASVHPAEQAAGAGGWGLGMSVILHRIPFGLVIWWTVRPRHGVLPAAGLLALIAVATIAGYALGQIGVRELPTTALLTFQALVAGALLHIVFEHPVDDPSALPRAPSDSHVPGGLGALVGAALVIAVVMLHGDAHDHGGAEHASAPAATLALALRLAPALVAGWALVAMAARLPGGRGPWLDGVRGALTGARAMDCRPGKSTAPAYRIAASVLGLDVILASAAALGGELTALRVAAGAAVAVLLAALAGWMGRPGADAASSEAAPLAPAPVSAADDDATTRALDRGIAWVAFGLLVAGVAQAALPHDALADLGAPGAFALALVIGWPAYICGLGLTPLALVLLTAGLPAGAALTLLLLAPLAHPAALAHVPRARRMLHRTISVSAALLAGVAAHLAFAPAPHTPTASHEPLLHQLADQPIASLALAALVALAAWRLLRRGPRALLGELTPGGGLHRHHPHLGGPRAPAAILDGFGPSDHDHGHNHHHGHHH